MADGVPDGSFLPAEKVSAEEKEEGHMKGVNPRYDRFVHQRGVAQSDQENAGTWAVAGPAG